MLTCCRLPEPIWRKSAAPDCPNQRYCLFNSATSSRVLNSCTTTLELPYRKFKMGNPCSFLHRYLYRVSAKNFNVPPGFGVRIFPRLSVCQCENPSHLQGENKVMMLKGKEFQWYQFHKEELMLDVLPDNIAFIVLFLNQYPPNAFPLDAYPRSLG